MSKLDEMLARQRALADFGDFALRSEDLEEILNEACRIVGRVLDTDLAKILEIDRAADSALVRAGVGWRPGVVGERRIPLSERSLEAYSIREGRPIVTKDIREETRFEFADVLLEHGAVALVNAPIFLPGGEPYGLLQVDSREPRDFGDQDIEFLRTYTTILGPVIDRLHKVHSLHRALEANQRLLQELQHRVKNHIGIIASIVRIRARQVRSDEAREELAGIGERVETLRLVHEHLYAAGTAESSLLIRPFVTRLVENLRQLHEDRSGAIRLRFDLDEVELTADVAVPLGLILNEFVVNSLKYAFDGGGGTIETALKVLDGGRLRLRISDDGRGRPVPPQPAGAGSGTGTDLIEGLARQIGAEPNWGGPGTVLRLDFLS